MNDARSSRRFPRYEVNAPFEARALRPGGQWRLHGRTVNFGEGGLGAVVEGELAPGELVSVRVTLPDCALTLQPRAQVRYRQGSTHGFEFINLSALQLAEVRACCYRLATLNR